MKNNFTLSIYLGSLGSMYTVFYEDEEYCCKLDTSKNSLMEIEYSNHSSCVRGIISLVLLVILFLFSDFLTAEVITVDEFAINKLNNLNAKHVQDAYINFLTSKDVAYFL